MSQVHNFSFGTFEWFVGVVEDRNDPEKLGRLKVRVFGYHADESAIPTDDLPWAQVMQPVTSSALKGVGQSPTGIQVGTHVVGFFADGRNAQTPIIMGSLAGKPEDEPDTNKLARGEQLNETVVAQKKASAIQSTAVANAMSGLTAIKNMQAKITGTMDAARSSLNGVKDQFNNIASLGGEVMSIRDSLNQVSAIASQIAQVPANAKALQAQLEGQISAIKGQVEYLKNIDPEEYAKQFANQQTSEVQASIRALKSLDFDSAMSRLQSIPMAIDQVGRLADGIKAMGDLGNLVSTVKGLSRAIPNVGAITGMARTIANSNVWSEPSTPAAPQYPLNKMLETEGGHIEEYDDTPGAQRYHRYHPAGTFTEVHPDGSQVDKVVKDRYMVVMGDDYLHVEGHVKVNIVGNSTVVVNGNCTTQVSGDKLDVVKGDYSLAVGGNISIVAGGSFQESSGAQFTVKAPRIDLN